MARGTSGSVTVAASGTAVQITTSIVTGARVRPTDTIFTLEVTPRDTNTGDAMYFGDSKVSTTYGSRVKKGVAKKLGFEPGRDKFSEWYADADSGGDIADWVVIW